MTAALDAARSIALARRAVNDARSHVTRASTAIRHADDCPVVEVAAAHEAAQSALAEAWESLAYIDALLAAAGDS